MSGRRFMEKDHTFAICAYGESPYLEECIRSVLAQKTETNVLIATSTPSAYIEDLAAKYSIPLFVNEKDAGKSNIARDWNYALSCCRTRLATVAHQDDLYHPEFSEEVLTAANRANRPLFVFTDYSEIRGGAEVTKNRLLSVKRIMLTPLKVRLFESSVFVRRRILSFGSAICCPSVTFCFENLPDPVFLEGYRADPDWQAWERFSRLPGEYLYCPKILMSHRIHEESATSSLIADHNRSREDLEMFRKFWPAPIAALIEHFYAGSEAQNDL